MMNFVGFKYLTETAHVPTKSNRTDAGFDLYADEDKFIFANKRTTIKTGISLDMTNNLAKIWTVGKERYRCISWRYRCWLQRRDHGLSLQYF
jgi:hypothetical protein